MMHMSFYCHTKGERFEVDWNFDTEVECSLCGAVHEVEWDYSGPGCGAIAAWTLKDNAEEAIAVNASG